MKAKIAKLVLALVLMGAMVVADANVMAADEIDNTMLSKEDQDYLRQAREKGTASFQTKPVATAAQGPFVENTMLGDNEQAYLREVHERGAAAVAAKQVKETVAPKGLDRVLFNLAGAKPVK